MNYIDSQMIANAINELDDIFDAHDVERRVLRNEPEAVAKELLRFTGSVDEFRAFSAQFSKFVDSSMRNQIQKVSKACTANLGGLDSECQQWRKLTQVVTAGVPSNLINAST